VIISASRRTDIPAFYSEWFINRLREGCALIPNPRNASRLGRVALSPDNVDCIVFWTKNPIPMLGKLALIDEMGYHYYIQLTLTPYGKSVEAGLPPKPELLDAFVDMSRRIGAVRSVWRYDPVFIDEIHTADWHIAHFAEMCAKLQGSTERCVFSFIDTYRNMRGKFRVMTRDEMLAVAEGFSEIAKQHGILLLTCSEEIDLVRYGIGRAACIDKELAERVIGRPIAAKKDANQRAACGCIASVDIGAYDTCANGCAYCYATSSPRTAERRLAGHDPSAPMITGYPRGDEIITDRTTPSQRIEQLSMF